MLIAVRHVTRYRYAEPVTYTVQSLRLTPASYKGQRVIDWQVRAGGARPGLQYRDGFGNLVHLITVNARHEELEIEAGGTVETQDSNGVVAGLAKGAPPRVFLKETAQTKPDGAIRALAEAARGKETLNRLHALLGAVRDRVEYVPGATDTHTSAAEALADGKGVCQDHAHIFIAAARTLAIPARYVTGYLVLDGQSTAAAHHAWAEAWVEGLGWVGFDVANRVCPTDSYVRLACGLDAAYAAPVVGSRRGGETETLEVSVAVQQQQQTAQQ
jgi:transglutaminase-like putative cysteine protease